jgi:hypothetical protein
LSSRTFEHFVDVGRLWEYFVLVKNKVAIVLIILYILMLLNIFTFLC